MERIDEEGETQESSRRGAWPVRCSDAKRQANRENGRKGGLVKSRKKAIAARRNARRPRPARRKSS